MRFVLSVLLTVISLSAAALDKNDYKVLGDRFKTTMYDFYKSKERADALRITEMTDECGKSDIVGKTVSEINAILHAAGAEQDFQESPGPDRSPEVLINYLHFANRTDYAATFIVSIKVNPTIPPDREIPTIIRCNVVMRSL